MLTERQQRILGLVVGGYLDSGKPIGSAAIAEDPEVEWRASTVRNELAVLEREGYLTHPHTSAGRVPTDSGYRFYADTLLVSGAKRVPGDGGARPLADAARDRGGAARDRLDALADDRPARRRNGATTVGRASPPRRGARAPAGGGDGRRHRLQWSRDQAHVQLRPPRSTQAWSSGRRAFSTRSSVGSRSARG